MKKVILSALFCFGVGLTLMGSPAQVSDDNNTQSGRNGSVTAVTDQPQNPIHHGNGRIKYEFTKKTIDPSKFSAPKMMKLKDVTSKDVNGLHKKSFWDLIPIFIISDPLPPINKPGPQGGGNGRQSAFSNNPPLPTR